MDAFGRDFLDRNDIGIAIEILGGIDHLCQASARVLDQHIGQKQCERFMADKLTGAPHGVTQAERRLLAREADGSRLGQVLRQQTELGLLAALRQG